MGGAAARVVGGEARVRGRCGGLPSTRCGIDGSQPKPPPLELLASANKWPKSYRSTEVFASWNSKLQRHRALKKREKKFNFFS
jgi:hypothetical protein